MCQHVKPTASQTHGASAEEYRTVNSLSQVDCEQVPHLGITCPQSRVVLCTAPYKHRAETLSLSPTTLQATSTARGCRKMQTDAKAECKATGRHCSGQKEETLTHHVAHHTDLWPLAP